MWSNFCCILFFVVVAFVFLLLHLFLRFKNATKKFYLEEQYCSNSSENIVKEVMA